MTANLENQCKHDTVNLLFASAHASVCFALSCLEPFKNNLRARSTFVDPEGKAMIWHEFGSLEGPGWAANSVGGAHLLWRWGNYLDNDELRETAKKIILHVLEDGFVQSDGLILPYCDLNTRNFCLNYTHNNEWLCPGSLARIGVQMIEMAQEDLGGQLKGLLLQSARKLADWLEAHTPLLDNGWIPRRITLDGKSYDKAPHGAPDPIYTHSADGLFLLQLFLLTNKEHIAYQLGQSFVRQGGFWGSINHDTFDDHENVAYAVAFRILRQAAEKLNLPEWRDFAYQQALKPLSAYRLDRNKHGVYTRGLFLMEKSWDTAYLWENAEIAQAYLEAWIETGSLDSLNTAIEILLGVSYHHYGQLGFLSEGIDWNNHVTQRHHINFDYYGAIRYTEPFLNNLHIILPTLTYFNRIHYAPPLTEFNIKTPLLENSGKVIHLLSEHRQETAIQKTNGCRYLLRLYHPALASDESLEAALRFAKASEIDAVLLFEASYDVDPALLPIETLEKRFARLKQIIPRVREAGLQTHINVMISFGHVDAGGGRPEKFNFQFMVDENGRVSRSTACPLDPQFLEYVAYIYHLAATCLPDVIWVDDDVRFLYHDLPGVSCFCPHHLHEMSHRTGRPWTREELVASLREDQTPHFIRQAWFSLQEEAILRFASRIENEIHAIDENIQIGLMTVGTTIHAAEGRFTDRLLRVLAGKRQSPWIRPGSGFWNDWEPGGVLIKTEDVARQVHFLGRDVNTVAEIENHPYSPFMKSKRILILEIILNLLAGTPYLSLNIFSGTNSFEKNLSIYDYKKFLKKWKPFLDRVAHERFQKIRIGVGIEASETVPRDMPLSGRPLLSWVEPRPWEILLGRFGFPVGLPQSAPHWLAGDVIHSIDHNSIQCILLEGAILTPRAVLGLLQRGFGEFLGIKQVTPAPPGVNEIFVRHFLNHHPDTILPVRHYNAILNPHLYNLDERHQTNILSRWINLEGEIQGVATAVLELPNGGRVGILPFEPSIVAGPILMEERRELWKNMIEWVARNPLPIFITQAVNLAPQVFVDPESGNILLAVINLSADDTEINLSGSLIDQTSCLDLLNETGEWKRISNLEEITAPAWSATIFRCNRIP